MLFFLIPFITLFFLSLKLNSSKSMQGYSIENTQGIKGFFVITIFLSHFSSYVHLDAWYDTPLKIYCSLFTQLMVAPFLFYSGFGIFESVKRKGSAYIQAFPKKRFLKTLLHFDFAIFLFLILDVIIGRHVRFSVFLSSLIGWKSIGNSNWFIFAILCVYAFSFIGLSLFKGNLKHALVFITAMSLAYIAIVSQFKASYWINTILAFPLGGLFSLHKEKFVFWASNKSIALKGTLLCILILSLTKSGFIPKNFINSQIALLAFSVALIFFSQHFLLRSKILNWFGANVFGIYILQRLPMNFFSHLHLNQYSVHLFFIVSFVSTIILCVLFSKWNDWFDEKVLKIPNKPAIGR